MDVLIALARAKLGDSSSFSSSVRDMVNQEMRMSANIRHAGLRLSLASLTCSPSSTLRCSGITVTVTSEEPQKPAQCRGFPGAKPHH